MWPLLEWQGSNNTLTAPVWFRPQLEFPDCWSVGCGPLHVHPSFQFLHWQLVGVEQAGWKHLQMLWSHHPSVVWISGALVGMKPAGRSIGQRHVVEMSKDSLSDWPCLPIMRLAVSNIDRVSPVKVARDCSMSAVELTFHFYVMPRWLLGRKKIQCCPGLKSEEQFGRTTLLLKCGVECRPVSQQECIQDFIHISLPSQF